MFTVSLNKQVFVLYAGLVASGYDLTRIEDSDPMSQVVRDIKNTDWDTDALRYFSQARLQHGGVNPYWPRAAMLLHAALHLPPQPGSAPSLEMSQLPTVSDCASQNALQQAIKEFPVDLSQKGDDTVAWVMDYPKAHAAFLNHPAMAGLWNQYQTVMGPSRLLPFEEAAADAVSSLALALDIQTDALPNLNVIPNPLQSPMIADFVHKDGTIHAVVAEPRLTSVVHELLHGVFAKALRDARTAILDSRHLFTPKLADAMVRMQYAWDGGDESWLRVFEETLVRAASIWVNYAAKGASDGGKQAPNAQRDARRDAEREACHHAEREAGRGFVYVPPILRVFLEKWHVRGPRQMQSFIEDCLKACAGLPSSGR